MLTPCFVVPQVEKDAPIAVECNQPSVKIVKNVQTRQRKTVHNISAVQNEPIDPHLYTCASTFIMTTNRAIGSCLDATKVCGSGTSAQDISESHTSRPNMPCER